MRNVIANVMLITLLSSVSLAGEQRWVGVNDADRSACQILATQTDSGLTLQVATNTQIDSSVYGSKESFIDSTPLTLKSETFAFSHPDQVFTKRESILKQSEKGLTFEAQEKAASYDGKSNYQAQAELDLSKGTFRYMKKSADHLNKVDGNIATQIYRAFAPAIKRTETVSCSGLIKK